MTHIGEIPRGDDLDSDSSGPNPKTPSPTSSPPDRQINLQKRSLPPTTWQIGRDPRLLQRTAVHPRMHRPSSTSSWVEPRSYPERADFSSNFGYLKKKFLIWIRLVTSIHKFWGLKLKFSVVILDGLFWQVGMERWTPAFGASPSWASARWRWRWLSSPERWESENFFAIWTQSMLTAYWSTNGLLTNTSSEYDLMEYGFSWRNNIDKIILLSYWDHNKLVSV